MATFQSPEFFVSKLLYLRPLFNGHLYFKSGVSHLMVVAILFTVFSYLY